MGKLLNLFLNNAEKNLVNKWEHYIPIYEQYFEKFVGKEVTILEIGIFQGGSLEIWKEYFGNKARIIAVDINEECKRFANDRVEVYIGSQEDRVFLKELKAKIPKVDILIDDGGHTVHQQIVTFEELYSLVKGDGLYICEDTHTSYWMAYGGSLRHPGSFIEYSKNIIDSITKWHYAKPDEYTLSIKGIHFYDSMVIIEKAPMSMPKIVQSGIPNDIDNLVVLGSDKNRYLFIAKMIFKRILLAFKRS